MNGVDFTALVGPALAGALEKKGFTDLMPVQRAVLDPALAGRDLRVSSQTGSGKTIAIGLSIRELVDGPVPAPAGVARPKALVVVPTRELAKQVYDELTWLYAPLKARVASATGGSDAREERRAFAVGPAVVVGTPGRLLDHLNRGSIDPSQVGAVVLDEADRMLDLGFRDELEAILAHAPPDHRTHLVSATFAHDVRVLADRVQKNPARIEGTPLGTANADIDHVVHLVANPDRIGAMVNLLLTTPAGAQTLVFARTRADVAAITRALTEAGFQARALSGEMEQRERNLALAAFKRGSLHALVATDVAARGIDVQDIGRVIHAEPPTDPDSYTHRSGRTGRAGRKGTSSILVSPAGLGRTSALLRRAGVRFRIEAIPSAKEIRDTIDERLFNELTAETPPANAEGEAPVEPDARILAVAERIAASADVVRTLARLLARSRFAGPEPHDIRPIEAPRETLDRPMRPTRDARGHDPRGSRDPMPAHTRDMRGPREAPAHDTRGSRDMRAPRGDDRARESTNGAGNPKKGGSWVAFRFTWGKEHGADPRRLLAMACRRGGVQATEVGAIHVARNHSIVEIASSVAPSFAVSTREQDPRDPRVTIRVEGDPAQASQPPAHARPHAPPAPAERAHGHAPHAHTPHAHVPARAAAKREYIPPAPRSRPGSKTADRPSRAQAPDRPSRPRTPDRPGAPDRPSRPRTPDRPSASKLGGAVPPKKKRPD
jgi:ATP-dependent RNA helicase DeaD